jgi:hypothetical protein
MPLDIQNYLVSEVCRCVKLKGKIREECEKNDLEHLPPTYCGDVRFSNKFIMYVGVEKNNMEK